jgi:hypothetical protein
LFKRQSSNVKAVKYWIPVKLLIFELAQYNDVAVVTNVLDVFNWFPLIAPL